MDSVHYLNIEYIFLRVYQIVTGIPVNVGQVPDLFVTLLEWIAIFGVVFSVVLLILIVYVRIRMEQVEHHGFHLLEEKEHMHHAHTQQQAKNPRWEAVVSLVSSPNESDWRRAILEADILLEQLLQERGYTGETVGEQLRGANHQQFTTLDTAWEAHRMRNALAHLGEAFPLSERDARATIDQYRRVFEEFDYI